MIVMDASAAVEIANATQRGLTYQQLIEAGEEVVSIDLVNAELSNTYLKYVKAGILDKAEALQRFEEALGLIDRFEPVAVMNREVFNESCRLEHPTYDIYYLVLARRLGATLLTFDKKLARLCDECGVERINEIDF